MVSYLIAMLTFVSIYALVALGLNIIWGMAGMINFGVTGFFALGAYVAALSEAKFGTPIGLSMAAGALVTALVGALTCLGLQRLRGDYFAIVTLGLAEALRIIAENEVWLTNGTDGISNIRQPLRGYFGADFGLFYLTLCVVLVIVAFVIAERTRNSPFGRTLRALRDDPQVASVAGKNVVSFQVRAFALGGLMIGLSGGLYAHYTTYIVPDIFVPLLTIYIFLAVTVGGKGNNVGTLVGTFVVVFLLESSRFITAILPNVSPVQITAGRGMLIGICFLAILQYRPWGLFREPVYRIRREAEPTAVDQKAS